MLLVTVLKSKGSTGKHSSDLNDLADVSLSLSNMLDLIKTSRIPTYRCATLLVKPESITVPLISLRLKQHFQVNIHSTK